MSPAPSDRPVLRALAADTGELSLSQWQPPNPRKFGIFVTAYIGSAATAGSDAFDFWACSPRWFYEESERSGTRSWGPGLSRGDGVLFGTGFVFMKTWSYPVLHRAVESLCAEHEGPDWDVAASRIGRFLDWEFQYRFDELLDAGRWRAEG